MSNFIYYEKLEDYEEQVRKAKECDEKDKEIDRLNDIVNKLIFDMENLMKYKRFIFNIIITPCECNKQSYYQLHNYTKQNLYKQLYNLREEIIEELKGVDKK